MFPKPRLTVRNLLNWVGAVAILLALGRYVNECRGASRRFEAHIDEAEGFSPAAGRA
jgi:hypothetical protein